MNKRVVITGIGVVSPLGIGIENFWKNLLGCKSGIGTISSFDTSGYNSRLAAEVKGFRAEEYIGNKGLKYLNKGTKFLSSAIKMALTNSGFPDDEALSDNIGIIIGSSIGNFAETTDYYHDIIKNGPAELSPMLSYDVALNSSVNYSSVTFKTKGFARTISSGFTSSADAIGNGFRMLQKGKLKAVIVGGVEHISLDLFMIFYLRKQLSYSNSNTLEASIPFDRRRNGFVLGEGSYVLILEDIDFASERGVSPYCEIIGYGSTLGSNNNFTVEKKINKAVKAMLLALNDGNIINEQVDLISANGNSSKTMDMIEAKAIRNLFYKDYDKQPPVSAIKSSIGECYGASGAAQAVAAAMTIKSEAIPPVINYEEKDPECDLNIVTDKRNRYPVQIALVNSFDYLGNNSCLLFRKCI